MKALILILFCLSLYSCSPKIQAIETNHHSKKAIKRKFVNMALIGFAFGIGIIGPMIYENVPAVRHFRK